MTRGQHGFTLIELLVVIAIVGLLAAVVLASVGSARSKGRDAAIRSELDQFATIAELEATETGTYTNLQPNHWFTSVADCNTTGAGHFTSGNYAAKARAICATILSDESGTGNKLFAGVNTAFRTGYFYSFMAQLSDGTYACVGSSGGRSTVASGAWTNPGCYNEP